MLTAREICRLSEGSQIFVVRGGHPGTWETVDYVWAMMDMEDLVLKSGETLMLEEYGVAWTAYREEGCEANADIGTTGNA